jgi:hypothetical protein
VVFVNSYSIRVMGIEMAGAGAFQRAIAVLFAAIFVQAGCAGAGGAEADRSILPPDAIVGAYDDKADAEKVRGALTAMRARFGHGPAAPFMLGQANLTEAKERISNGSNPENALEYALRGSADDGERTIRFWCVGAQSLDTVRFPRAVLTVSRLNVAIAVLRQAEPRNPRYFVILASYSLDENTIQFQ